MALAEQDKKTLQIGLFVAAIIAVGAIYSHHMFFSETKERTLDRVEEMQTELRDQQQRKSDLIALRDRQDEIEALAAQILEAAKRLPDERNAHEFYAGLVGMLHNTGVDYDAVRPLPDRRRQLFTEMPYLIDSNAAFHEFGQFLNLIEENPNRFMRVSHIDVTNSREHPTVHPANLEITTFTLHDVPTGNER